MLGDLGCLLVYDITSYGDGDSRNVGGRGEVKHAAPRTRENEGFFAIGLSY